MSDLLMALIAGDNVVVLVIGFLAGHWWATRKLKTMYQAGKNPFEKPVL